VTSAMRRQHEEFAVVRRCSKLLQISIFILNCCHLYSSLFFWVGVRLVSTVSRRFRESSYPFVILPPGGMNEEQRYKPLAGEAVERV
jgi:hypothetical protein